MPDELLEALSFAFGMFWEILWALILGFFLSAVVQREPMARGSRRLVLEDLTALNHHGSPLSS